MKPAYRKTFFSVLTGAELIRRRFLDESNSDNVRAIIIRYNRRTWNSIRPKVAEFYASKWEIWEEAQPEWFAGIFKEEVDDDLLPAAVLREMKTKGGGQRRRSSIGEKLGIVDGKKSSAVAPSDEGLSS
jgi:hypothetical protein